MLIASGLGVFAWTTGNTLIFVGATLTAVIAIWKLAIWPYAIRPVRDAFLNIRQLLAEHKKLMKIIGTNGAESICQTLHVLANRARMAGGLQHVLDVPIFELSPDGDVVDASRCVKELMGWSVEDLKRGGLREYLDEATQEDWDDAIQRWRALDRDCLFRHADGDMTRASVLIVPVVGEKGQLIGWNGRIDLRPQQKKGY